jgi:ribosomal protein L11 methyltransferase
MPFTAQEPAADATGACHSQVGAKASPHAVRLRRVLRIAFRIPAEAREDVLDGVLPLLPGGIVERQVGDAQVEISSVGAEAVLPDPDTLRAAAGVELQDLTAQEVPADWRERRRLFGGSAFAIDGKILIRSPWDPPGPEGLLEIVVERGGGAFGSGSHPTTQMCLSLLLGLEPIGGATDLGCGAGTLGIAAARLGWGPITAIDLAPEAVELTARNAQTNGVEVDASQADLRTAPFPPRELLLVNAPPPVQERVAAAITPQVRHVIVSGIVEGELPEVREQSAAAGFAPARGLAEDTWVAVLMERGDE